MWRKDSPRSVLLESREIPDEALLFESATAARLCKEARALMADTPTLSLYETQNGAHVVEIINITRLLNSASPLPPLTVPK